MKEIGWTDCRRLRLHSSFVDGSRSAKDVDADVLSGSLQLSQAGRQSLIDNTAGRIWMAWFRPFDRPCLNAGGECARLLDFEVLMAFRTMSCKPVCRSNEGGNHIVEVIQGQMMAIEIRKQCRNKREKLELSCRQDA